MSKICNDCNVEVPNRNRSGFCRKCYDRNRPRSKRGSEAWQKAQETHKRYYQRNKEREQHRPKLIKYKVSLDEYQLMLENQEYRCAICNKHQDDVGTLNIDHDHSCCPTDRQNVFTCGECIRDLLCTDCNQGLGRFKDDIKLLKRAIGYLQEY